MTAPTLKERINGDLKAAMLAGDKPLVEILRSLKSAVLYREVADDKREQGLDDESSLAVLKKEKKSRQDAYDMYTTANEAERAGIEKYQMDIIAGYLPEQLSEADAQKVVEKIVADAGIETIEMKHMGLIMGKVKASGVQVDGSVVSKVIKGMIGE